jgi:hypothetical protein
MAKNIGAAAVRIATSSTVRPACAGFEESNTTQRMLAGSPPSEGARSSAGTRNVVCGSSRRTSPRVRVVPNVRASRPCRRALSYLGRRKMPSPVTRRCHGRWKS